MKTSNISPPTIYSPIYPGAQIVGVEGMGGYRTKVYANGQEIGDGELNILGWGPIRITRSLKKGDVITAIHYKDDEESYPTWPEHAVTVGNIPHDKLIDNWEKFQPPKIVEPLYQCQRLFWAENLVEGVEVSCELMNPAETEASATPYNRIPIWVRNELAVNQTVRAKQKYPASPFPKESDFSSPAVQVESAPNLDDPKYKPVINTDNVSIGTSHLVICNTLPGAKLRVYAVDPATGAEIEFGTPIAAGGCTFVTVSPITTAHILANQWLCDDAPKSPPSDPAELKPSMYDPEIEEPICPGAVDITVNHMEFGANVELWVKPKNQTDYELRGGGTLGYNEGRIKFDIGGGEPFKEGDEVRVRQRNASQVSNWSNIVTVGAGAQPKIEIKNGIQHQSVPGNIPLFYRGVLTLGDFGPVFRAVMCGAELALVRIYAAIDRQYKLIEEIKLSEIKRGYFEGGWDWKHAGWKIPEDIPIGEYIAKFILIGGTNTYQQEEKFFVGFDPNELRRNITAATQAIKASFGCAGSCRSDLPSYCCYGPLLNESQVNQFFSGSPPWKIDCFGAANIIMARGLIKTLKSGEFDKLGYRTPDFYAMQHNDMHIESRSFLQDISMMEIGEWGYIKNDPNYLKKHPGAGYQGENIIKVSPSTYYGFPEGTKTYQEWKEVLINAYNVGDPSDQINDIPGFQRGSVKYIDITKVSVDVWEKLRKP